MIRNKQIENIGRKIGVAMLALFFGAVMMPQTARAADTVYTCNINPCYSHPVTGVVEDSGGSSSQATGQGMAESAISTQGSLTVGDDGSYKLNFTMSLIDYTSNQAFWVQSVGDSDWSKVSAAQVGTGSDSNGTTAEYQIEVPSESCIVKASMYVDPMGRDVIFYFYPSDYTAMGSSDSENAGTDSTDSDSTDSDSTDSDSTDSGSTGSGNAAVAALTSDEDADDVLDEAAGLSLSTEDEAAEAVVADESSQVSHPYICLFFTIVLSGSTLILLGILAVYFCRRNWKKWGGTYEDDEEA